MQRSTREESKTHLYLPVFRGEHCWHFVVSNQFLFKFMTTLKLSHTYHDHTYVRATVRMLNADRVKEKTFRPRKDVRNRRLWSCSFVAEEPEIWREADSGPYAWVRRRRCFPQWLCLYLQPGRPLWELSLQAWPPAS